MRGHGRAVVAALAIAAAGCGEDERAAAPPAARTPAATATPTPTPTASAALARATSEKECARLWNEDALDPENYQVTANEFVAELAPVRVHVAYQDGNCFVVAPIGNRRIAIFTAADGRRPFTVPTRRKLKRGERIPFNARADREGIVALDS